MKMFVQRFGLVAGFILVFLLLYSFEAYGVLWCHNTSGGSKCLVQCKDIEGCDGDNCGQTCFQRCYYSDAGNDWINSNLPACPGKQENPWTSCTCTEGISCGIHACPPGTGTSNPYNLDPVAVTSGDCIYYNGSCTSGNNQHRQCMHRNVGRQNCYPTVPDIFAPIVRLGVDYNTSALGCTQDSVWLKNPETVESAGMLKWEFNETSVNAASTAQATGYGSMTGVKRNMMYTTSTSSQIQNTPGTQYFDGADDYIEVSNSNLRGAGPTTLEMWGHPVEPAYTYPRVLAVYGQDTHDVTCKNCDEVDAVGQVEDLSHIWLRLEAAV
ncbi:MAG: hypothetical protein ACOYYJ_08270 [Chloroflexota bacterium]